MSDTAENVWISLRQWWDIEVQKLSEGIICLYVTIQSCSIQVALYLICNSVIKYLFNKNNEYSETASLSSVFIADFKQVLTSKQ